MNRVLTLSEVLGLEDGARVYGECRYAHRWDEPVTRKRSQHGNEALCGHSGDFDLEDVETTSAYGTHWRVWSLPQPPTPEELAANPWPEVHHE